MSGMESDLIDIELPEDLPVLPTDDLLEEYLTTLTTHVSELAEPTRDQSGASEYECWQSRGVFRTLRYRLMPYDSIFAVLHTLVERLSCNIQVALWLALEMHTGLRAPSVKTVEQGPVDSCTAPVARGDAMMPPRQDESAGKAEYWHMTSAPQSLGAQNGYSYLPPIIGLDPVDQNGDVQLGNSPASSLELWLPGYNVTTAPGADLLPAASAPTQPLRQPLATSHPSTDKVCTPSSFPVVLVCTHLSCPLHPLQHVGV